MVPFSPYFSFPVVISFHFAGARFAQGNVGKINFWTVHVVAEMAAHKPGGPVPLANVAFHAWRHGQVRSRPPKARPSATQEPNRENTSARCRHTLKDQTWRH